MGLLSILVAEGKAIGDAKTSSFVKVSLLGIEKSLKKTNIIKKTADPKYNCTLTWNIDELPPSIAFKVKGKKVIEKNTHLGGVSIASKNIKPYESNLGWHNIPDGGKLYINIIWSPEGGDVLTCTVCAKKFACRTETGDRCVTCSNPCCYSCSESKGQVFSKTNDQRECKKCASVGQQVEADGSGSGSDSGSDSDEGESTETKRPEKKLVGRIFLPGSISGTKISCLLTSETTKDSLIRLCLKKAGRQVAEDDDFSSLFAIRLCSNNQDVLETDNILELGETAFWLIDLKYFAKKQNVSMVLPHNEFVFVVSKDDTIADLRVKLNGKLTKSKSSYANVDLAFTKPDSTVQLEEDRKVFEVYFAEIFSQEHPAPLQCKAHLLKVLNNKIRRQAKGSSSTTSIDWTATVGMGIAAQIDGEQLTKSEILRMLGDFKDNLGIGKNSKYMELIGNGEPENVLFSDYFSKINKANKQQKRIIVLTDQALYNFKTSMMGAPVLNRRVFLPSIDRVEVSNEENLFLFHIPSEYALCVVYNRFDMFKKVCTKLGQVLAAMYPEQYRNSDFVQDTKLSDFRKHIIDAGYLSSQSKPVEIKATLEEDSDSVMHEGFLSKFIKGGSDTHPKYFMLRDSSTLSWGDSESTIKHSGKLTAVLFDNAKIKKKLLGRQDSQVAKVLPMLHFTTTSKKMILICESKRVKHEWMTALALFPQFRHIAQALTTPEYAKPPKKGEGESVFPSGVTMQGYLSKFTKGGKNSHPKFFTLADSGAINWGDSQFQLDHTAMVKAVESDQFLIIERLAEEGFVRGKIHDTCIVVDTSNKELVLEASTLQLKEEWVVKLTEAQTAATEYFEAEAKAEADKVAAKAEKEATAANAAANAAADEKAAEAVKAEAALVAAQTPLDTAVQSSGLLGDVVNDDSSSDDDDSDSDDDDDEPEPGTAAATGSAVDVIPDDDSSSEEDSGSESDVVPSPKQKSKKAPKKEKRKPMRKRAKRKPDRRKQARSSSSSSSDSERDSEPPSDDSDSDSEEPQPIRTRRQQRSKGKGGKHADDQCETTTCGVAVNEEDCTIM